MSEEVELKYPSPRPKKESFTKYWNLYLPDIQNRENFKASHLSHLKVLCDLNVEYDELYQYIQENGRTYTSVGRNGTQIKLNPEVMQLKTVVSDIRNYSKMLGILLYKDKKVTEEEEENGFDSK
jgi:phage terminase small subunit